MASLSFAMSSALVMLLVASASFLLGRNSGGAPAAATFQPQAQPQAAAELRAEPWAPVAGGLGGASSTTEGAHIYFLLDRSGSMMSIRDHVISGFNSFVEEQRSAPGYLRMTLLQFDSQDPRDVVFAGRDIKVVAPLTAETFVPRGMTPLYDALGFALATAEQGRGAGERVVLVTFSDGQENDSREHSRETIFSRITEKRGLGWTFVFLGANQDSFAESARTGYGAGNTQNFKFDGKGTRAAFESVSTAMSSMRTKLSSGKEKSYDSEDFFEGKKFAEADYRQRAR